ncbi:MAG: hypothetical protein JWM11_7584 [Planctomycetaceae bacterium]|nr:hypothetical protein [Planctomycetaceae bacterium]
MSELATIEVLQQWPEIVKSSAAELSAVLEAIERFANDTPGRGKVNFEWWVASIKPAGDS